MNFSFLENKTGLEVFHSYCSAAENLAMTNHDVSITAARMAMEYMLKLLYGAAISPEIAGLSAYDMLCDPDLIRYLDDRSLVDAFHYIRKAGNVAVHSGGQDAMHAVSVLEKLHYLAGETAIVLGVITNYPPFDAEAVKRIKNVQSTTLLDTDEPQVEPNVIQCFTGRLHSASTYSLVRFPKGQFVETFISGSKVAAQKKTDGRTKGTDMAANSRIAFRELLDWFIDKIGIENLLYDSGQQLIVLKPNANRNISVAVKTGACRLAVKTPQGDWDYMPGIDYVLYVPKVSSEVPILQQFRVYTSEELVKMWQDAELIRIAVPSGIAKKLKQLLGPDATISIKEYGTEMTAQILYTAKQSKQQKVWDTHLSMPLLECGGYEKILNQPK